MTEYMYKGFKVVYKVESNKNNALFGSSGHVIHPSNQDDLILARFRTYSSSKQCVSDNIKKLMEKHIDFERRHAFVYSDSV